MDMQMYLCGSGTVHHGYSFSQSCSARVAAKVFRCRGLTGTHPRWAHLKCLPGANCGGGYTVSGL